MCISIPSDCVNVHICVCVCVHVCVRVCVSECLGDEEYKVADLTLKGSKSHQWFGASVRATDKYILVI